ncbi:DUF2971 domain-containing protein [Laribacter hongkongensis]|uniref:DUF2971 domain-containing protein n=1 Tax=Laribacter hongkongensis TaxID=168471 RepID=A0ABD4SU22_9NEIS|nr:DUF2971 domain-containing protein [Laribacter hongkongensis]MCG9026741.1 DUF2971 domain-containing protein [Laribacter hongkongensis]MCG9101625.1 DUF2971 domain-containing protein [Laribacter hongkongensis]MCG9119220.1 DUF2971 domain-containing protein [Laribacter hongkongensis]
MAVSIPNVLYHYTDINALISIIQNKKIWLSSARNLNDKKEIDWSLDILVSYCKKLLLDERITQDNKMLLEGLISHQQPKPYICSMSERPDVLSQWRAYGDDGVGVSIGFNSKVLPDIGFYGESNRGFSPLDLHKVIYDYRIQLETMSSFVHFLMDSVGEDNVFLKDAIHFVASAFKNDAFCEEREYRIVYNPALVKHGKCIDQDKISEIKFRKSNSRLVSYYEYDIFSDNHDHIKEIWFGPKCEIDEADLRLLLEHNGLSNVEIKRSAATYR